MYSETKELLEKKLVRHLVTVHGYTRQLLEFHDIDGLIKMHITIHESEEINRG